MANNGFTDPVIDLFNSEIAPDFGTEDVSAGDNIWSLRRTNTVSQLPDGSFITSDKNGNIDRI